MASAIGIRPYTYFLVEFYEENEQPLYVVPSNWLVNNETKECYWPNFIKSDNQRFRAAKDRREPNPETWLVCPIRVKYRSYSMERAISMMKRLEEGNQSLTNEETDTGVKQSRLRAKKRKINYEWRNVEEEDVAYANNKSNQCNNITKKPHNTPSPILRLEPIANSTPVTSRTILTPLVLQSGPKPIPSCSTSPKPPSCTGSSQSGQYTEHRALPCDNFMSNTVSNERVFTILEELTNQVRANSMMLNKIWGSMHLQGNAGGGTQPQQVVPLHEPITGLPCNSIQELIGLNEILKNREEMSKRVTNLGFYGGKDEATTVWCILNHVMTTSLSDLLRWAGRHGKRSIQEFPRVLDMITLAVKQTYPNAQSTAINNIIKPWLRGSRDRDGRRAKRVQIKPQSNPLEDSNTEIVLNNPPKNVEEYPESVSNSCEKYVDGRPTVLDITDDQEIDDISEPCDYDVLDFEDY